VADGYGVPLIGLAICKIDLIASREPLHWYSAGCDSRATMRSLEYTCQVLMSNGGGRLVCRDGIPHSPVAGQPKRDL
jgi:hypothetical protein